MESSPRRSSTSTDEPPRPLLYTAQDVAHFCEVDLKTIHHWADAGKIPHHRTEGRHLRFRRNHLVHFLRSHGYPLHAVITSARPTVFFAAAQGAAGTPSEPTPDEIARKLGARFFVRRFECALAAIAHLIAGEPDALILSLDDATIAGTRTIAALKADAATSWTAVVVIGDDPSHAREADLVLSPAEISRLPSELAKNLGVE